MSLFVRVAFTADYFVDGHPDGTRFLGGEAYNFDEKRASALIEHGDATFVEVVHFGPIDSEHPAPVDAMKELAARMHAIAPPSPSPSPLPPEVPEAPPPPAQE